MRLSAFDTYSLYLALKNHFTRDSYDFFKYKGKTNASQDSFSGRKDKYQFQKLSRLHDEVELQDFIIANILAGKTWVGDLLNEDAEGIFRAYQKIQQSLSYHFTNEIDSLFLKHKPSKCFSVRDNSYPHAFMSYLSGKTSIQTLTILNNHIGFYQKWDTVYADDSIWLKNSILLKKYAPFLEYDKMKIKTILKNKIKEYEHGEEQEACRTSGSQREEAA